MDHIVDWSFENHMTAAKNHVVVYSCHHFVLVDSVVVEYTNCHDFGNYDFPTASVPKNTIKLMIKWIAKCILSELLKQKLVTKQYYNNYKKYYTQMLINEKTKLLQIKI